jgi:hypothetical protein
MRLTSQVYSVFWIIPTFSAFLLRLALMREWWREWTAFDVLLVWAWRARTEGRDASDSNDSTMFVPGATFSVDRSTTRSTCLSVLVPCKDIYNLFSLVHSHKAYKGKKQYLLEPLSFMFNQVVFWTLVCSSKHQNESNDKSCICQIYCVVE